MVLFGACTCRDEGSEARGDLRQPQKPEDGTKASGEADKGNVVRAVAKEELPVVSELPPPKPGMVWAEGTINNLAGRQFRPHKIDVEVCVFEQGDLPCVKTNERGGFAIQVPKHSEVALLFRSDKLIPTIRPFLTGDGPVQLGNSRVANLKGVKGVAELMGKEYHEDEGVVFIGGVEGVTAQVIGQKPPSFFLDRADVMDSEATSMPMHGSGGFFNVKPGMARLRFSLADGKCFFRKDNILSGWPDPAQRDVARVPIRPGHYTHMISMLCEKSQ